jgi:hypothetical protein
MELVLLFIFTLGKVKATILYIFALLNVPRVPKVRPFDFVKSIYPGKTLIESRSLPEPRSQFSRHPRTPYLPRFHLLPSALALQF